MASFEDTEFGPVAIRRSPRARNIKLSVTSNGSLRVSMPSYAPLFLAKRLLNSSRASIRQLKQSSSNRIVFRNGDQVGKSHSIATSSSNSVNVRITKQLITVAKPPELAIEDSEVQDAIRSVVIKILRKEAKSYLPRRLAFLAKQHTVHYERVRFSYASTRWGSCSSNGTISLNISLMMLPFELIDYVLLHELAHTRHMDHSAAFWELVGEFDPNYKTHRKALKSHSSQL